MNLRWEKVDFQRDVIYVPISRTGKDYEVAMNADVRNTLLIRKPRVDYTHGPQTVLNERLWKPCECCGKMFAKNLPQQQNGCQSGSR